MAAASAASAPLRVVIIGAGVAGLSAASCLKDAQFWKSKGCSKAPEIEVLVLEARDRQGGRIWTEHFADGTAVDLGAAWLHGNSASNPLSRLSKLCGAELVETDWENALVFEAVGSEKEPEVKMDKISDDKLKKVENIFSTLMKLYKSQQRADRKAATGESEDRSLMATLRELKSKKFKGIDSFDERTRLLLLSELDAVTEHDYAATPEELSSTWWDEDEEFPGGHSLWKHGFASLIEYLSHGINVILNARVVRISHCETKVSIQLENGHCYEADHCICTIPLGVLKRDHPTLFDPPLPESKLRSISRLGVGAMEKVALRFEDCFWEGSPQSRDALHCIYRIPTTEGRRHSGAMEAPYFVSLKPVTSSNTLVAYYVTDGARQLVTLEAAERVRHTLQLLCTMFGPLESRSLEEKLLETLAIEWKNTLGDRL